LPTLNQMLRKKRKVANKKIRCPAFKEFSLKSVVFVPGFIQQPLKKPTLHYGK